MGHLKNVETDIVITGGSLEGCIAALELAKKGYQVLLTEKKGSLGGAASNGLEITLFPELVSGTAAEYAGKIWQEAGKKEGIEGPVFLDQKCKLVLARLLKEAGVTVLTHIFPFDVKQSEKEVVLLAECKTETLEIHAKVLIDGDSFGSSLGMAQLPWKQEKTEAEGAVKWSGISGDALKKYMAPDVVEKKDCLIGKINLDFVMQEHGIAFDASDMMCCHNTLYGETIFSRIPIKLPDLDIFTLSDAYAGFRKFAYALRDNLHIEKPGFEKAAIIHVAPELEFYGIRRFPERSERLFAINITDYTNEAAIIEGIDVAARVSDFLK